MLSLADLSDADKERAQAKARELVEQAVTGPLTSEQEQAIRNVFMVLHGYYGNLFFSRYVTGQVAEDGPNKGEDEGMVNARRMWAYALRRFTGVTIKAALGDVRPRFPEYPPSLPQFEALCVARTPRGPAVLMHEGKPVLALPMDQKLVSRYARQARAINERHAARAKGEREGGDRRIEPGLAGLKEAIADAVGAAGGDEASVLLRLDRELTKASHG